MNTAPDEELPTDAPLNDLIDCIYQAQTHRIVRLCALEDVRGRMSAIEVAAKMDVADDSSLTNDTKRKATIERRLAEHDGHHELKCEEAVLTLYLSHLDTRLECLRSRLSVKKFLLANETARLNAGL